MDRCFVSHRRQSFSLVLFTGFLANLWRTKICSDASQFGRETLVTNSVVCLLVLMNVNVESQCSIAGLRVVRVGVTVARSGFFSFFFLSGI